MYILTNTTSEYMTANHPILSDRVVRYVVEFLQSGNPENGIDHTGGNQAGAAENCAAVDACFLGVGHSRGLLAVGRQDQRGIHTAGQASAGETVGEVLCVGQNGSLCVGEEGLGDVYGGVIAGCTLDSLRGAVGSQSGFDPLVHRVDAADEVEISGKRIFRRHDFRGTRTTV